MIDSPPARSRHNGGATHANEPQVQDVREHLRDHRRRSTLAGLLLCLGTVASYAAFLAGTLWAPWLWLRIAFSFAAAAVLAPVFVVGHDACHGSLTPHGWMNRLIGRVTLIPCWHPYAAWEHFHNGLHHGFTNLRTHDPVFPPLSLGEYRSLSPWMRCAERLMRSPAGVGVLYVVKVWTTHSLWAPRHRMPPRTYRRYLWDRVAVLAFVAMQAVLVAWISRPHGVRSVVLAELLTVVLPPAVFLWIAGWAVHIHHTHPKVAWFEDRDAWSFFRGQVQCGVHMAFPRPVELFILNIMDHTAHHADSKIPLYELHEAQRRLEHAFPNDVVHEEFTFQGWLRLFRICRLYDYRAHRWLDWDGTPLTEPLLCSRLDTPEDDSPPLARDQEADTPCAATGPQAT